MGVLPGIFSLLVGACGWYYLFYSRAARNLGGVEDDATNLRRDRLRRIGGLTMLLLGGFIYAGFYTVDAKHSPAAFLLTWIAVFVLLLVIVLLALIDLRLTARLRRNRTKPPSVP
jgi:drug/metabolite transporter (DMT)-like permease